MKRILSFIVAITATAFLASAQTDLASIIFSQAGKKVNYIGQYDDNRRDKNGTGISRDKQGNVYVGDFMRGKFSGYGMLIMANNASIKDLPGTTIYVGEWIDGKREGKGTCYSHDGDVIYSGLFSENYPVSPYPTPRPDQTRYFSDTNTQDEYYIGEMRNGKPDGFGMFLTNEGTLAIGKVTAGRRTGVGLLLAGDGNWKMVKWSGYNTYDEISSTADYNTRIATYREVASKQHAEFRQGMLDVASGLMQTLSQSQQIKSGGAAAGRDGNAERQCLPRHHGHFSAQRHGGAGPVPCPAGQPGLRPRHDGHGRFGRAVHFGHLPAGDVPLRRGKGAADDVPHHLPGLRLRRGPVLHRRLRGPYRRGCPI